MTSEFVIAVHALVYLNHKDTVLSSEELADNICTNPARIRKVMTKLKKANMVETKEGIKGGYRMVADAKSINLNQICEALDLDVVKAVWKSGSMDMECLVGSGMAGIMDGIFCEMDELCKNYLEKITIQTIDGEIFGK